MTLSRRLITLALTLFSVVSILGAWGFEAAGILPCAMCYWQRWGHWAALGFGWLAFFLGNRVWYDDGNGTGGATDGNKAQVKAMEAMAAMREAAEANDETKARKVLARIRLREGEKALPKGTVDRAQQMFDDAFAEATNAA